MLSSEAKNRVDLVTAFHMVAAFIPAVTFAFSHCDAQENKIAENVILVNWGIFVASIVVILIETYVKYEVRGYFCSIHPCI